VQNLPSHIGRYEILGLLGTGGMAEVFLGRLRGPGSFERPVVIKRILPHLAREQQFVDMFLDEARIVAGLRHQNVVTVHELGQENDELFLVMEYLEGESLAGLARRLSRKKKLLSFGLCAHVLAEVCAGLHAAHEMTDVRGNLMNLVHRDISPANIFVTYAGEVKILDFGIAVASDRVSKTEAGQVKGKYAYMSPEQCAGKELDRRSDVFSLGTVLYELSTCRRLFKRGNDVATIQAICNTDAQSPSKLMANYPPSLDRICAKALMRKRNERYQSALDMRRDLLDVSRQLNEGKLPEESLSRVMHKLFVDRIDQKRRMLTSIKEGAEITNVPVAETDAQIELPAAAYSDPNVEVMGSHSSFSIQSEALAASSSASRKAWWVGAIAAGLLVIVGTAAMTVWSGADADAHQQLPSLKGELVVQAPPPPSAKVKLRIETQPAEVTVLVGGQFKGVTPMELELDRSETAVEIGFEREGFTALTQVVVPSVDQLLRVSLDEKESEPPPDKAVRPKKKKIPKGDPYTRFN
jgi:eukaryotic-like serine/threonine-protein kinase